MKKVIATLCMVTLTVGLLAGCGKKEDKQPNDTEVMVTEEETDEESREGMARSYLTGEWIDEDLADRKPVAIMIGNTNDALPQYGVSRADVVYEVPAEGGITRLMPIFQDYSDIDKIGSVRSCRHYYAYYAMEFEAVYLHCGQASYAEELLGSGKIEDLNALDGAVYNKTYYKDSARKAPHNTFTSTEGIDAGIALKEFDPMLPEDYEGHYLFNKDDKKEINLDRGEDAIVVQPGYYINNPWFVYDEETGLYNRFQYKREHMDELTDTQLAFKNIILQYTDSKMIDEKYGYMDFTTVGKGAGKYITNGRVIDITWSRDSEEDVTRYYDMQGREIVMNQGKTMVCVLSNGTEDRLGIYANEDDFTPPVPSN